MKLRILHIKQEELLGFLLMHKIDQIFMNILVCEYIKKLQATFTTSLAIPLLMKSLHTHKQVLGFCVQNSHVLAYQRTFLWPFWGYTYKTHDHLQNKTGQTLTNQRVGFERNVWTTSFLIHRSANN